MDVSSEPMPQPRSVDLSQVDFPHHSGDSAALGNARRIPIVGGDLETASPDIGRIVEIQLGIMSKQLELLRDQDSTDGGPQVPIAPGIH